MLKNIGFGTFKEKIRPIKKNKVAMERYKRYKRQKQVKLQKRTLNSSRRLKPQKKAGTKIQDTSSD